MTTVLDLLRSRSRDITEFDAPAVGAAVLELIEDPDGDEDEDELITTGVHLAQCHITRLDVAVTGSVSDCHRLDRIGLVLFGYWQVVDEGPEPSAVAGLLHAWRRCEASTPMSWSVPFALQRAAGRLDPSTPIALEVRQALQQVIVDRPEWADALRPKRSSP